MGVAVLVVSHRSRATLDAALASVRGAAEVAVVDNASGDGTPAHLQAHWPHVRTLASADNLGFGRAVNLAAAATRSPLLLLLNPDAALPPGAVSTLPARFARAQREHGAWAVGFGQHDAQQFAQLAFGLTPSLAAEALRRALQRRLDAPGSLGARLATAALRAYAPAPRRVAWVAGSALLVSREAFLRVGGFDPGYFLYFEDIDFCLRLRHAGGRIVFDPTLQVLHHRGRSMAQAPERARRAYRDSQRRWARQHLGPVQGRLLAAWAGLRRG